MTINFHPAAEETAGGNSFTFQEPDVALVGLFVTVTDVSGVLPSLTVTLQQSPDGNTWFNVGSIAVTRTSAGSSVSAPAALALLADYFRITWTVSNNAIFNFTADVVGHKVI